MARPEKLTDDISHHLRELEVKTSILLASQRTVPFASSYSFDYDSTDQALARIQQQLRIQRNASLPAVRTPPELLGLIFKLVQAAEKNEIYSLHRKPGIPVRLPFVYDWMAVTHVCHYWRQVAISSPALWTSVRADHRLERNGRGEAQWYIANSGNMPLSVYLHVSCIRMPRVLYQTFDLMSRIRELRLTGELSELNNLHLLFNHPAPELEVFAFSASVIKHWCLDGKRSRRYGVRELLGRSRAANRYRKSHQLPLLFLGHHPRLESLYLRFFIHFGYNAFHTVKKLHLSRQFFTTAKRFKFFLDLLDGMPMLEELILSWVDFGTDPVPLIDIDPSQIRLKSLQRLALVGMGTPDIERVLQCLVLPPDLALSCDMGCNWGETLHDLFALLGDRLRNACHVEIEFDSAYSHANILIASATFAIRFVACGYGAPEDIGDYLVELALHADIQDLWIRLLSRSTGPVEIDPIELGGYFTLLKNLYIEFPGSKTQVYFSDWLAVFGRTCCARNLHFLVEFLPTAQMKAYIEEIMTGSQIDVRVYTTDAVRRSSSFHPLVEDFMTLDKKGLGSVDFLPARRFPKIPLPPVCASSAGAGWVWSKGDQSE